MRNGTVFWFLVLSFGGFGLQAFSLSDTLREKKLRVYPFAFYTKETSLAAGGAALYFLPHSDSARSSYLQFTAVQTIKKQTNIELWYQIFSYSGRYKLTGFTDYNRFPLLYFGTGEMPGLPEAFTPSQIRSRASMLRRISSRWWIGPRYWFESNTLRMTSDKGQLNMHPQHHRVSAPGLVFQRDTRNNFFYPSTGTFFETSILLNVKPFGATSSYRHILLDYRVFFRISTRLILATQLHLSNISGSPSVMQLNVVGGPRLMRGYYLGMFRDKHVDVIQEELRYTVSARVKAVVFGSLGSVRKKFDIAPTTVLVAGGAGMRVALDVKKQIHLRADLAVARNRQVGFYILMEEAF